MSVLVLPIRNVCLLVAEMESYARTELYELLTADILSIGVIVWGCGSYFISSRRAA